MMSYEIFTSEKVLIAVITALSAFLGGFISTLFTYYIKNKEIKFSIRKDKRDYINTNIIPKFELLLGYLEKCREIVTKDLFTNTVANEYNEINFHQIKLACNELEVRFGVRWLEYFKLLDNRIKESFKTTNINIDSVEIVNYLEENVLFFQAFQMADFDAGNLKLLLWKYKAKKKFEVLEKKILLLQS